MTTLRCLLSTVHCPLLLCLAALAAAGEAPAEDPVAKLLEQARAWSGDSRKQVEVLRACEEVATSPLAKKEQKVAAFGIMADTYRSRRKFAELVQTLDRLRAAFPDDKELARNALLDHLAALWGWNKSKEGVEKANELIAASAGDKACEAAGRLWLARFLLHRTRKPEDAYEEARKASELAPQDDKLVGEALLIMYEAAWTKGEIEKALDAATRFLDPKYLGQRSEAEQPGCLKRPGDCLLRLQRYDGAAAHFLKIEKATANRRFAQECCLLAGRAALEGGKHDVALKALERVVADYPELPDLWHGAQAAIVDALRRQGKFAEALKAARICLDASADRSAIASSTLVIAEIFRSMDGHVGRANQMINFQRYGPDGEDGKPGTPDDLKDPLAGLPRPSYPDRERAFAEARKKAGDTAQASRYRALTHIYAGNPKEALKCYLDAFARSTGDDYKAIGQDMIVIGARAVRGYAVGLKGFVDYVNCGPAGPDGKPGTADDLKNPFEPLLK
ncbi:MAG TPA: hypothetical protein VNE39_21525 [Planctomycetota bacterium]|nr:hypothetical protein [Planctomycetota bacterium]